MPARNVTLSKEQNDRVNKKSVLYTRINYDKATCPVIVLLIIAHKAKLSIRQFIDLLDGMGITEDEYLYVAKYLSYHTDSSARYIDCSERSEQRYLTSVINELLVISNVMNP